MDEQLLNTLYANQNGEKAFQMAKYMKNQFPFLGIIKPERVRLTSPFIKEARQSKRVDWEMVDQLWNLPEREFQYVAMSYLLAVRNYLQAEDINKLEALLTAKSWWDTVDLLACNAVGPLCLRFKELTDSHILRWAESENIWLARSAILFQLKYKDQTDPELLRHIILQNSRSQEFFINKAIGWVLREYSKTDKEWVRNFLAEHLLSRLSVREAGKYL